MTTRYDLSVLHIGAGKYASDDRGHVTYGIWRELASGFRAYHVVGRARGKGTQWSDGNLTVTLLPSDAEREAEFLLTQFKAVGLGVRMRPDAIVCQSPVLGGLAALAIARRTGARTLMEIHGADFFAPAKFGSRLWLYQKLSGHALRKADRIRVLSSGMRERLAAVYGASLLPKTSILPPRVDLSRFAVRTVQPDSAPLRLAMVGAVNSNKGQLRLIRALAKLPFAAELHIAGAGPELEAVRAAAESLAGAGSKLQVVAHGALPHAAVADMLRQCHVFVMYSRTEAAPRAIMEAMAVGLPVITTNVGFCADIVESGTEGFVLDEEPDRQIVDVLARFQSDRGLAERLGKAARERARRDYDSVRLFDEYRRLIAETAAR